MIDKLQAHYGFTRMPFGRDLAPGMLHRHAAHNEACARITWCIAERAIGVITGEVGAGKTVSVRTVLASLDASRHTIIYLPNPMIGIRGLHEMIVATFGGQPDRSYSRLTAQASAMLAAERDERGKTPVLVIDEAHLLRYEQLETIRMLTNHNLDADSPLACLLIGQPTLRRTMKLAVLAALEQRTALRYAMPPMTSAETSSYISHHLKLAGRSVRCPEASGQSIQ
jgi:type II secretory pathway predicted ATPase ExeA